MITDQYSLVELVLGASFVLWGISSLINKHLLKSQIKLFLSNESPQEAISYLVATMFLVLGIIIISVHNDWYMGLSIVTTVIGWILVVKCFLWLAFKKSLMPMMRKMESLFLKRWVNLSYGIALIVLGVATLWNHFLF